jgi:geranylgeranyl diphosphate synthase type I
MGDPDLDDAGADAVRAVVVRTGALASIELLLAAQHAVAVQALTGIPEPARGALRELADEAIRRRR